MRKSMTLDAEMNSLMVFITPIQYQTIYSYEYIFLKYVNLIPEAENNSNIQNFNMFFLIICTLKYSCQAHWDEHFLLGLHISFTATDPY